MKPIKEYEYIKIMDNGVTHYDAKLYKFTEQEALEKTEEYYKKEESFIEEILNDGFIEFPILWNNGPEPIWSKMYLPPEFVPSCSEGFYEKTGMKYNIYIPSYNRAETCTTDKTLEKFGITNYYMCINPSQYPLYKKTHKRKNIIIRDPYFKSDSKADLVTSIISPDYMRGAIAAFNSLLYISKSLGEKCYWTIDDDIYALGLKAFKGDHVANVKYDKDKWYRTSTITEKSPFDLKRCFNDMSDLFDKMRNKAMMSIEKYGLAYNNHIHIKLGTRSYSFYLTNNATQCDHVGQQNNDIITSLEMSKYGYVNMLQEGFPCYHSADTQVVSGGSTNVYTTFGTMDKAKVLVQACPNYSKISYNYNRIHHLCDFSSYNKMRLVGNPRFADRSRPFVILGDSISALLFARQLAEDGFKVLLLSNKEMKKRRTTKWTDNFKETDPNKIISHKNITIKTYESVTDNILLKNRKSYYENQEVNLLIDEKLIENFLKDKNKYKSFKGLYIIEDDTEKTKKQYMYYFKN